jgi:GTPase
VQGFVDETTILVSSGKGGHGAVSFRREKYVPKGGPDGGDGGRGGDVVFQVRPNLKTLSHLAMRRSFRAQNGRPGEGRRRHGADGSNAVIQVPPGTRVYDRETGELLEDLRSQGDDWVFLSGGRGGKGNAHFATSTHQTPRFAQEGADGKEVWVRLELALIADVGFLGLPNAGKSSLLAVLTNAHPEVAAYPFTTKIPNLGVMRLAQRDVVLADIPGIVEGASEGVGLGHRFLRHVSRTAGLAFLVDLSDTEPCQVVQTLEQELAQYDKRLLQRPRIVVGTKLDLDGTEDRLEGLVQCYPEDRVVGVSAYSRRGLEEVQRQLLRLCS